MRGIYELETLRDSSGNAVVVTGATVTVRKESDGLIAQIYNAVSGGSALANPLTIAGSTIQFYAEQNERYRIDITSGTLTRTIRYQSVSIDTLTVKSEAATESAGQVTAHNEDDDAHGMSASGRAVLRGTPAQGRTALELGNSATLDVGVVAGTVCAGNDPRLAESGGSGVSFATVTPATDEDVTLTSAEYGANAIILVTGAWTEARNIIVPDEAREWQFFNDGTYAATVKTAAGTGIIVQPGVTTRLICDATNVLQELTMSGTSYDGTNSGLAANNGQDAFDELALRAAISVYATAAANTTVSAPIGRSISALEYTAATGTITLPASEDLVAGARVLISKSQETMGAVNINADGTDAKIWGTVQLRLYSDGDYWLLMWTGSRWVLLEGFETGSNANGEYVKYADGTMICVVTGFVTSTSASTAVGSVFTTSDEAWTFPAAFISVPSLTGGRVAGGANLPNVWLSSPSSSGNSTTTTGGFRVASALSLGTVGVSLVAIGPWK